MEIRFSERKQRNVKRIKLKWLPIPGAKPSAVQAAVIRNMTHRNLFMFGGFGSGKTAAAGYKAALLSVLNPSLTVGAVGQSYKAAKKDLFPAIEKVLTASGLRPGKDYRFHKTEHRFDIWAWNGTIQGSSAEDPDILVGDNWAAAVGNEPGLWPEKSYLNMLARVRDPAAKKQQVALFGTPEGFNWLYRYSVKRYPDAHTGDQNPAARIYFTSTRDATWLGNYADELVAIYPDDLIAEKVEGQFINVGAGQVYAKFSRERHVQTFDFFEGAPLIVLLDFNIAPGVALVCQVIPTPTAGPTLFVHDVVYLTRGSTADVIRTVAERYPVRTWATSRFGPRVMGEWIEQLWYVGDATGKAVHATGLSCYQEVRRVFDEAGWAYVDHTPDENPPVSDRIAVMNGSFEKSRIFVHARCLKLIDDLEMVTYVEGTRRIDKAKDKSLTHTSDALGYGIHELFGRTRPAAKVNLAGTKTDGTPWGEAGSAPWHEDEDREGR